MNILFVQHELFTWQRAKMWGYTWHLGLEEGLRILDKVRADYLRLFPVTALDKHVRPQRLYDIGRIVL